MSFLRRSARHRHPGFTLIEVMVVVSILAIVAISVVPAFQDQERLKLVAGVELIRSDLELATVMTISSPSKPIVVRFNAANSSYWLAPQDQPNTAINRADTGDPYVVILGTGRADFASGVSLSVSAMTANTLTFNELGGLADVGSAPVIRLTAGDRFVDLAISATTGSISETYGGT